MSSGVAMVNGALMPLERATLPVTDPALTVGWSVFETLQVRPGQLGRAAVHLARLAASCEAAFVPFPGEALLLAELAALGEAFGAPCRVRLTLTGGGNRVLVATAVEADRRHRPVRAVRGVHRDEPYLGGRTKHGSRLPWVVAQLRSGCDEVLLVDAAGRFTEGTTCAVLAVLDGALWLAPDDGRVLPSTTVDAVLARADRLGIPWRREGPPAAGPWQGLYVASTTRDLAPVVELDGDVLPGWESVGRALAAAADDDLE